MFNINTYTGLYKHCIDYHIPIKLHHQTLLYNSSINHSTYTNRYKINLDNFNYYNIYNNIYNTITNYKLIKHKKGEDKNDIIKHNEIYTRSNNIVNSNDYTYIANLIMQMLFDYNDNCMMLSEKLWNSNIYYKKKNKKLELTPTNSRAIVSVNKYLKHINKFFTEYFIKPIFLSNNIDPQIHTVLQVYTKKIGYDIVNFNTVATIANTSVLDERPKIQLDLSNAFNNVDYDFLYNVLSHYYEKTNINDFIKLIFSNNNDNDDTTEKYLDTFSNDDINKIKHNFITSFINIIKNINYIDNNLFNIFQKISAEINIPFSDINPNLYTLKRNKGLPQGCSFSTDLFILCMDYITKEIFSNINSKYNITLGIDYSCKIYVDDIMITIITQRGIDNIKHIINEFEIIFTKYKYKINTNKTKFSPELLTYLINENNLDSICDFIFTDDDKFLGIYYSNDISNYIHIFNQEIFETYSRGQDKQKLSLETIDKHLQDLELHNQKGIRKFLDKKKFKLSLCGKINYRFSKFLYSGEFNTLSDLFDFYEYHFISKYIL
jgi:hypothetical protein